MDDGLLARLQRGRDGLAATRPAVEAGAPVAAGRRLRRLRRGALGAAARSSPTSRRWCPYWLGEIERVLDGRPEPVPFGRIATDADAASGIVERDRSLPPRELYDRIDERARPARSPLADADAGRPRRGADSTRRRRRDDRRGDRRTGSSSATSRTTWSSSTRSSRTRPPRLSARARPMFILYAIPIGIVAGYLVGGRLDGSARCGCAGRRWPCSGSPSRSRSSPSRSAVASATRGRPSTSPRPRSSSSPSCATCAIPGVALIALGAACNLAAIVANGGWMPADPDALASIGGLASRLRRTASIVADPALGPLTDLFALPAWLPFANVFSIGDVLIGSGSRSRSRGHAIAPSAGMRRDRIRSTSRPARRGRAS